MSTHKLRIRFLDNGAFTDRIEWGKNRDDALKNLDYYGKIYKLKKAEEWNNDALHKRLIKEDFAAVLYPA